MKLFSAFLLRNHRNVEQSKRTGLPHLLIPLRGVEGGGGVRLRQENVRSKQVSVETPVNQREATTFRSLTI